MAKRWRDDSLRLKHYDYGSNGAYFVTLNTKNRIPYFGSISDAAMIYSPIGQLANEFWTAIPQHFPFVELDEFIVMPDHIHGIIVINKKREAAATPKIRRDALLGHPDRKKGGGGYRKEWKPGSLGVIINQFKRICTINARKINPGCEWQPNFHDRIIWDDFSYNLIAQYIKNNPKNWES